MLAAARPAWIAAVVLASLATVYIRAQRWCVLLRPVGRVPLYPALSATAIGFGASSVLPFRAGELVRPALLGRQPGVGMSAALSSVVLERLFDMLLVIGCFLAVALVNPEVPPDMRRGAFALAALAALGFLGLALAQRYRTSTEAVVGRLLGLLPRPVGRRLVPLVASFMNGLGGLADLPTVLLVLAYSAYLWGVITLTFLFSFLALGIQVPLVAAAVFLPQAPGFVGTWQAGCVLALRLFDVPHEVAVGFSLLTWVIQMAVNIATGGIFLAREDLPLARLLRLASREAPAPAAGAES